MSDRREKLVEQARERLAGYTPTQVVDAVYNWWTLLPNVFGKDDEIVAALMDDPAGWMHDALLDTHFWFVDGGVGFFTAAVVGPQRFRRITEHRLPDMWAEVVHYWGQELYNKHLAWLTEWNQG